jgi:taurine dioxygenase
MVAHHVRSRRRLAVLHALEVPSAGGGTMFADMRAAYDGLPEVLRRRLDGLVGLHGRSNGPDGIKLYGEAYVRATETARPERRHPAVKQHPVTGRSVLFVNPTHTPRLRGHDDRRRDA